LLSFKCSKYGVLWFYTPFYSRLQLEDWGWPNTRIFPLFWILEFFIFCLVIFIGVKFTSIFLNDYWVVKYSSATTLLDYLNSSSIFIYFLIISKKNMKLLRAFFWFWIFSWGIIDLKGERFFLYLYSTRLNILTASYFLS
jgi:hypothetical protein